MTNKLNTLISEANKRNKKKSLIWLDDNEIEALGERKTGVCYGRPVIYRECVQEGQCCIEINNNFHLWGSYCVRSVNPQPC